MSYHNRLGHNERRFYTPIAVGVFAIPQDQFGNVRTPGFANTLEWLGKYHRTFILHGVILNAFALTAERVLAVQSVKDTGSVITNSTTVINPSLGAGAGYGWNYIGDIPITPASTASLGAGESRANGFVVTNNNAEADGFLVWSIAY